MHTTFDHVSSRLRDCLPTDVCGSVTRISGLTVAAADFPAPVGAVAEIERPGTTSVAAEVIGFDNEQALLYALDDVTGLRHGSRVKLVRTSRWIGVGDALLGRVLDAQGRAIDGLAQPVAAERVPLDRAAPAAVSRPRIETPLTTGVRAIDGLLTCGKGQRMGIFAGSGIGKSTLLGMMTRYTAADVNVVALVGERGREVNEFLQRDLGRALAKSVVIVATSDEPALARVRAAQTATAVAEYFRDRGRDVLLVMDSLTRLALAQREIGLAAGEPPTTRGFPPSVFALLPKLLERAGCTERGSITGIYSVLVEGDDPQEPIADTARGLLDGHVWLARKLAARGHFPAIDVLESVSRLMNDVTGNEHREAARRLRELLAAQRDCEDLVAVGAYRPGSNRALDTALALAPRIDAYLRQPLDEASSLAAARDALVELSRLADAQGH